MNSSMGCWSVCEKNKDESGGGKLKENHFYTRDKLPFWLEELALNLVEKNSFNEVGKTGSKSTKNLGEK